MPRVSVFKSAVPAIAFAASALLSGPAGAADMVTCAPPHRTHVAHVYHQHPHHVRVVRTAYLARQTDCDDRIVEYRDPYIPHTEIVRVCNHYRYNYRY